MNDKTFDEGIKETEEKKPMNKAQFMEALEEGKLKDNDIFDKALNEVDAEIFGSPEIFNKVFDEITAKLAVELREELRRNL